MHFLRANMALQPTKVEKKMEKQKKKIKMGGYAIRERRNLFAGQAS